MFLCTVIERTTDEEETEVKNSTGKFSESDNCPSMVLYLKSHFLWTEDSGKTQEKLQNRLSSLKSQTLKIGLVIDIY